MLTTLALGAPIGAGFIQLLGLSGLIPSEILVSKEIIQTTHDVSIAARPNGFLEHARDKPIPGFTTRFRSPVDGREEILGNCYRGLA